MNTIAKYVNGNYSVELLEDGTRIMRSDEDEFIADFPDNIDLKITDRCDCNCPMCHESSSSAGRHAILNADFLNSLHGGTELAIGGGDAFSHPDLTAFLRKMKEKGVICNITVNEKHLPKYADIICRLWSEGLIYGLGISVFELSNDTIAFAREHSNVVLHAVCGVTECKKLLTLDGKGLKLLVLGYKIHGRGKGFFSADVLRNIGDFSRKLPFVCNNFSVVAFDNLALKQLKIKDRLSESVWNRSYCGCDGMNNLYVDLVNGRFAKSSRSNESFPIMPTAEQMLSFIHKKYNLCDK